jgi:hypothetical protein
MSLLLEKVRINDDSFMKEIIDDKDWFECSV